MSLLNTKTRFNKLTLKKNKLPSNGFVCDKNKSEDLIVFDDSFDRLMAQANSCVKSPIVINDSSEMSIDTDLPIITIDKQPSKSGNASFNNSQIDTSIKEVNTPCPSNEGWSPAQGIICATPRHLTIPTTPRDEANESTEQCSIKKIQKSQKKLLNDLYGEVWKSIPKLFHPKTPVNLDCITKKLQFNDDDEKENIREAIAKTKELYLTDSDAKHKTKSYADTEKKSKKKLYTEIVPNTPDPAKTKVLKKRDVNTTNKKLKGKSVTELVEIMNDKFTSEKSDKFTSERSDKFIVSSVKKSVKKIQISPVQSRLSFVGSLADNIPSYRCHPEAIRYRDDFKTLKEKLTRRLFEEFNQTVFGEQLDNDMVLAWDTKLRSTAGTTTNRLIKNSKGERIRSSSIKLSVKVLDRPERLRDTLIHELCHAATWVIDLELRAGHGPVWKKWAKRALKVYPELGEISRCHDMQIHFKYTYKCTRCGYSIQRHSKSLDITKKCCGYCRGTFEIVLNKKNKDGAIVSTPARKGEVNDFALYVKEHYGGMKDGRTHAQVMKVLGEQFSANKMVRKNLDEVS